MTLALDEDSERRAIGSGAGDFEDIVSLPQEAVHDELIGSYPPSSSRTVLDV